MSLREILFVGEAELRWPLSKMRRGHRLGVVSFFQVPHTRLAHRKRHRSTPRILVTRLPRGPTGTVAAVDSVFPHYLNLSTSLRCTAR